MSEEYPNNLVDLLEDTVKKFPDRDYIGVKNAEGEYEWFTFKQVSSRVDNLRAGLAQAGVGKDDVVGVIVNNCLEWVVIAFATFGRNARLVPMYEKELESIWKYIIKDSGVKVLFAANDEVYGNVKGWVDEIDTLKKIYVIHSNADNSMVALEKLGAQNPVPSVKPQGSDIAELIYTSGTTGDPKGVLLSHRNITSNVLAVVRNQSFLTEEDRSYTILPWAHAFGQTCELYVNTLNGESFGLCESLHKVMEDIVKVKPTVFVSVPRVFNAIYNGIHLKMKAEGKEDMLNIAKQAAAKLREGEELDPKEKAIMEGLHKQIRGMFGGRLKYVYTGGAVMSPEVGQFYLDMGIIILDGYGMTETSPTLTGNSPENHKFGSVGKPIDNVTIIIDKSRVGEDSEDGEILAFGPNIMQGYHNKPDKTAEIIVEHPQYGRGVRTGDRGRLDEEGYLYITGRFKEEYKLENGKYVHPASIEEDIMFSPFIANAMVYGEAKPYNVALIIPDFEMLNMVASKMGITKPPEELIKIPQIQGFLNSEIAKQLEGKYEGYEIPKKIIFISEVFTVENELLTQTSKLKRPNVLKKYGAQLNALYN